MNVTVEIVCPYCRLKGSHVIVDYEYGMEWRPQVLTCDVEIGGCNKPFAALVQVQASARVFRLEEVKSNA